MAKTGDLKRRIRSTKKTRQITKTMEMVSTSKLKRASDRVHAARPYAEHLNEVIGRLLDPELRERHPLLRQPDSVRRAAILLLTSNRGLAGAFNVNLIREARGLMARLQQQNVQVDLHVVGRKGVGFFRFQKTKLATERTDITDRASIADASALVDPLREAFERGDLDELYVVYAQFRSALSTPPATLRILPVATPAPKAEGSPARQQNYILSPSADEIL